MTVQSFRRSKPARLIPPGPRHTRQRHRGSSRERGYTGEWDKARDGYIRLHPNCEECLRRGYLRPADVVDHMEPARDRPDRVLDATNFDSLCNEHHNGWKRKLERFARATRQIALLPTWVKRPETRPAGFQITRTGPLRDDGTLRP